jgi:hypothetical protein
VTYTAPSGGRVFSAGTLKLNWALDNFNYSYVPEDPRLQRFASNMFDDLSGFQRSLTVGISAPAAAFVGATIHAAATVGDTDGEAFTYAWTVDGVPQTGTGSVIRLVFTTGGIHSLRVTVNDGLGLVATSESTVSVTQAGGDGTGLGPTAQVAALAIRPRTFVLTGRLAGGQCVSATRANRRSHSCVRKIALRVSYKLQIPALLNFTISHELPGRLIKRRCVQPARENHGHHDCTRLVAVRGIVARIGSAGANSFQFDGRIGNRVLGPGSYWLIVIPTTSGHTGSAQSVKFQILR